jgi:AcrR family transcriptional regulator
MVTKAAKKEKLAVRREREAEWIKELIVEAAASVFAQNGYHGATIENIAAVAGYSPAAIYKYFDSKEAIFTGLRITIENRFSELFADAPPVSLAFDDYLRWFLSRVCTLAERHRNIFLSFMAQVPCAMDPKASTEFHKGAIRWYVKHMNNISKIMEKGIADGALRDGDPVVYATAFFGIVQSFVMGWLISARPDPLPERIDTIVDLFLNGAGNGVKTAASGGKS